MGFLTLLACSGQSEPAAPVTYDEIKSELDFYKMRHLVWSSGQFKAGPEDSWSYRAEKHEIVTYTNESWFQGLAKYSGRTVIESVKTDIQCDPYNNNKTSFLKLSFHYYDPSLKKESDLTLETSFDSDSSELSQLWVDSAVITDPSQKQNIEVQIYSALLAMQPQN